MLKERFEKLANTVLDMIDKALDFVKEMTGKCVTYVKDHPKEALAMGAGFVAGLSKVRKWLALYQDKQHRELDFYDRRTGSYTRARRQLKNWEKDEVEFRYRRGESYNDILRDMRLRK